MYRGPAGIDILNKKLQEIFNPNDTGRRKEVQFGDIKYRVHDKVLQLINQPEKMCLTVILVKLCLLYTPKKIPKNKI